MQTSKDENNLCEKDTEDVKTVDDVVNCETNSDQCFRNDIIHNQSVDEFADINESYIPLNH